MAIFPCLVTLLLCIHFCSGRNAGVGTEDDNVEVIKSPLCTEGSIPYRYTKFPNILGLTSNEDSSLQIHQFFPLFKVGCSAQLGPFLCSVYFPPLTKEFEGIVPPCRSLCEAAKQGCEGIMNKYGFGWPTQFECERFPQSGVCFDGDSIIDSDAGDTKDDFTGQSSSCQQVTVDRCKDILPYKMTSALGPKTQRAINDELNLYKSVFESKCNDQIQDFLCSFYLPECRNDSSTPVRPCRSLCLKAMTECRKTENFDFEYLEDQVCQQLPESGNCYAGLERKDGKESASGGPGADVSSSISSMPNPDQEDPDKPTSCTTGNYNCRHASSRVYIDGHMTCCLDERILYFQSGRSSDEKDMTSSCKCIYPTPPGVPSSC